MFWGLCVNDIRIKFASGMLIPLGSIGLILEIEWFKWNYVIEHILLVFLYKLLIMFIKLMCKDKYYITIGALLEFDYREIYTYLYNIMLNIANKGLGVIMVRH